MDFGTETYSASYYRYMPNKPFDKANISRVYLTSNGTRDYVAPTIAAWHGRWIFGKELEGMLHKVPSDKIIKQFKLALYDPHKDSIEARKVHRQLRDAGKQRHELLTQFLKHFWGQVWSCINEEFLRRNQGPKLSETLVYITVPMLITDDATTQLRGALTEAGIPNAFFLYEPLCAGASVLEEVIRKGYIDIPASLPTLLDS